MLEALDKDRENRARDAADAARWRKLCTHLQSREDATVMRGMSGDAKQVYYVGAYRSGQYGHGFTLAEAVDSLP